MSYRGGLRRAAEPLPGSLALYVLRSLNSKSQGPKEGPQGPVGPLRALEGPSWALSRQGSVDN